MVYTYNSVVFWLRKRIDYLFMFLIQLYVNLIGNPFAPKNYRALAKYYESIGKHNDSETFKEIINIKFHADDTSADEKQSEITGENP